VLGKVVEVVDAGAVPVLEIQGPRRFQVPLADTFVRSVDVAAGVVLLEPRRRSREESRGCCRSRSSRYFPRMVEGPLSESILGKAREKGLVEVAVTTSATSPRASTG
jgi:hypothetical protein